jgi:hypothetical protein
MTSAGELAIVFATPRCLRLENSPRLRLKQRPCGPAGRGRSYAIIDAVCMQCAAVATTAVGAASGIRAWLAAHGLLVSPARARAASVLLGMLAVIAAGVVFSP